MQTILWIGIAIVVVLIILGVYIISIYNTLVGLFNRAQNAFAQIDVQLKRRYDLIPNMVEVAKKYLKHEEETLLKVIQARNSAKDALDSIHNDNLESSNIKNLNQAENILSRALNGLNVVMEAYPDLKANQNLMHINEELTHTENKIAFARQAYNDSVMNFNTAKQLFPTNILVGFFTRFKNDMTMLEFSESKEELNAAPKIKF